MAKPDIYKLVKKITYPQLSYLGEEELDPSKAYTADSIHWSDYRPDYGRCLDAGKASIIPAPTLPRTLLGALHLLQLQPPFIFGLLAKR